MGFISLLDLEIEPPLDKLVTNDRDFLRTLPVPVNFSHRRLSSSVTHCRTNIGDTNHSGTQSFSREVPGKLGHLRNNKRLSSCGPLPTLFVTSTPPPLIAFDTSAFSRLFSMAPEMIQMRAAVSAAFRVLVTESLMSELGRAHQQDGTVHHVQRQVDFLRSCLLVGWPDLGSCVQEEIRGHAGLLSPEGTQRLLLLARNDKGASLHAGATARARGWQWVKAESDIQEKLAWIASRSPEELPHPIDLEDFFSDTLKMIGERLGLNTKGLTPAQVPTFWCLMHFNVVQIHLIHTGALTLEPNNALDMDHYVHAAVADFLVTNDHSQLATARLCQPPGPTVLSFNEWVSRMSLSANGQPS